MNGNRLAVDVVGAGGIGCVLGYALAEAGVDVTLIEVDLQKVDSGRREGVQVDGRPPRPVGFVAFAEWSPREDAVLLLCTKCYDNAAVLRRVPASALIVPVQNGYDPQLQAFGHTYEGIASFVSECAPYVPRTRITRGGALHLGPRTPAAEDPRWERLLAALQRSDLFRLKPVADIEPFKRTKLMYNAAISPLAAAAGLDNGQLLSSPIARRLFFDLLLENYSILSASGGSLGRVGPFSPPTVAAILRRRWLARLLAKAFEPSLRGTYCSMAGEIPKGRTEIDNYNGHLIRLAELAGIPCPINRAVYDLVHNMTQQKALPSQQRLSELSNALYGSPIAVSSTRRECSPVG